MNPQDPVTVNRASGAAVGFIIACVIFFALAVIVKLSVHVPAVDADRSAFISNAFFEIRTNEAASLSAAGWIDRPRGIVRLPIDDAMKLVGGQTAASIRADLVARQAKADAPAPKQAPQANPFE